MLTIEQKRRNKHFTYTTELQKRVTAESRNRFFTIYVRLLHTIQSRTVTQFFATPLCQKKFNQ